MLMNPRFSHSCFKRVLLVMAFALSLPAAGRGADSPGEEAMIDRTFKVPKGFGSEIAGNLEKGGTKGYLEEYGIVFPPNASVTYRPVDGVLTIHNTIDNINDVEMLVSAAWSGDPLTATTTPTSQPVDQRTYYGSVNYDYDRSEQNTGTVRVERSIVADDRAGDGEGDRGDQRRERRRTLRAKLGEGGKTFRIRSGDGSIRIER